MNNNIEETIVSLRELQKQQLKAFHLKKLEDYRFYYRENKTGGFGIYYRRKSDKLKYLSSNPKKVEEFFNMFHKYNN